MIHWHWAYDGQIGRTVRLQGEFEDCASSQCVDGTPPDGREDPMTEAEWSAQALGLARRMSVFGHLEKVSHVRDTIQAVSFQTDDPHVREAFRHLSYACRLMFLYGNEIETVPVPDFVSWEK